MEEGFRGEGENSENGLEIGFWRTSPLPRCIVPFAARKGPRRPKQAPPRHLSAVQPGQRGKRDQRRSICEHQPMDTRKKRTDHEFLGSVEEQQSQRERTLYHPGQARCRRRRRANAAGDPHAGAFPRKPSEITFTLNEKRPLIPSVALLAEENFRRLKDTRCSMIWTNDKRLLGREKTSLESSVQQSRAALAGKVLDNGIRSEKEPARSGFEQRSKIAVARRKRGVPGYR